MNHRLVAFVALLLALGACGTRSGLLAEATGSPGTDDAGVDGAATDGAATDGAATDGAATGCVWGPRMNGRSVAEPARVELASMMLRNVQVVAYDDGYFFVVDGLREFTESPAVIFGTFDESGAEPIAYDPISGSAARLAPVSRSSVFSEGERLLRLEQDRLGFSFPGPGTCTSVIHGNERAYAWVDDDGPTTFIWDVELSPTAPFEETVVDEHIVTRVFPESITGAVWDAEAGRAIWLTGEVRAAVGEQSLWLFDGEEPQRVVLQTGDDFVWLHGLALRGEGIAMTLDLDGPPQLVFIDIESGVILEEQTIPPEYFDNAGAPTEGHFAAHADGTLANLGGVLVDFPASGAADSRVVFDEHASREPGRTFAAHDVAVRGSSAVTAMVVSTAGTQSLELRHYECR